MDGNGRWAQQRQLPRVAGHRAGVEAVRRVLECAGALGIKYLTLYAFSTENWKRPQAEVDALMRLLVEKLTEELPDLVVRGVHLRILGNMEDLPCDVQDALRTALAQTAHNSRLYVNIALNYGGRRELVDACQKLARQVQRGELEPGQIDEEHVERELYTASLPDPDLLIRPGGEYRVSNFLLWQIAYAELYMTPTLWPDFGEQDLIAAVAAFQKRDRRFGGLKGRS
jgi:undecaprenyl diphosphate synthase